MFLIQQFAKKVSTRKKKNQQKKKQLRQLHETVNDVFIGNGANVDVKENEVLEQQTNGQYNNFGKFVVCASQNKIIEKKIDE